MRKKVHQAFDREGMEIGKAQVDRCLTFISAAAMKPTNRNGLALGGYDRLQLWSVVPHCRRATAARA